MIRGKSLVAVIPARGGSKGIPGKNLYKMDGLSLVERAIQLGKACERVDRVFVSTDHPGIYAVAKENGCATPSLRPESLAADSARTIDVISDLVNEGVIGVDDCLILLQPSSPLRTQGSFNAVCDLFESAWKNADAVVSVCEIENPHPYKAQIIRDGYLCSLLGLDSSVPRQTLPETYIPNGAFYLAEISVLLGENSLVPARTVPYIMPFLESINLDNPTDLLLLEAIIDKGLVQFVNDDVNFTQA